ncbi:hypothetical protein Acy02nite_05320 [Actinoplanes cyaneus]|uniref:Uncharacterized protein n=1 Tax=Actinoplanes cyaneus TaxID=52696 RepID=A0A919IE12_9ACTN|nr:hypothetical protein [Actinoplanes cyaneus]MCW2135983.1 hypothetical protein [Actinoplanes cyaneus]GID62651.1 hypothetical protein Acy02nite_05320 [Actinoplanes cyaneus]
MNQHDDSDPLASLEDWARKTERKVRRQRRLGGFAAKLRYVVMAGVAVALIVAAIPLIRSVWPEGKTAAAPAPTIDGVTATTSASAKPTGPFDGTAAASYPIGTQGITLPKATAVTGFTAVEVGAALKRVRDALVAGRLDQDMTVDHRPDDFLALLAPSSRTEVSKWFASGDFGSVATWIDPKVKLDPANQPRVSGRITYKSVVDDGIHTLRVTTNFVWVYAFQGEFLDRPLAVKHDEIVWNFPATKNLRTDDRGMWVGAANSYGAWLDCDGARRGLLAPTPKGGGTVTQTEDQDSLAKPDHALDIGDNCH